MSDPPNTPTNFGPIGPDGRERINFRGLPFTEWYDKDLYDLQKAKGAITERDETILLRETSKVGAALPGIGLWTGSLAVSGYGLFYRRPRWSFGRAFGLSTLAAIGGLTLGQLGKMAVGAASGLRTLNMLEDKQRVFNAILEMREQQMERLGVPVRGRRGPVPVFGDQGKDAAARRDDASRTAPGMSSQEGGWSGEQAAASAASEEQTKTTSDWEMVSKPDDAPSEPVGPPDLTRKEWEMAPKREDQQPERAVPKQPSSGESSVWDAIRSGRSPPKPPTQSARPLDPDTSPDPAVPPPYSERDQEQRQFDELLEKERRFGQDGGGKGRKGSGESSSSW